MLIKMTASLFCQVGSHLVLRKNSVQSDFRNLRVALIVFFLLESNQIHDYG